MSVLIQLKTPVLTVFLSVVHLHPLTKLDYNIILCLIANLGESGKEEQEKERRIYTDVQNTKARPRKVVYHLHKR